MIARSRLGVWALAGLVLAACAAPVVWLYLVSWPADQWQVDLEVYREAGVSVLHGRAIYEVLTPPPQLLPFTYPPFAALLSVPLALVSMTGAGWLWTFAQIVATGLTVWYAGRAVWSRWSPSGRSAVVAWAALTGPMLWLHPVADGIRFGQVNAFLVLICLLDLRPGGVGPRWLDRVPRGVLIGLAMAIKLTPGIFVVHLVLQRRWRAAAYALVTAAVATVGTFVVMPRASLDFWFAALLDPTRLGYNGGTANQSLRGWILRSGPRGEVGTVLWLVLAAVVVVVGMWAAGRLARSGLWVAEAATVGFVGCLVSPVSWIHHYHWAVVAALALLAARPWMGALTLAWFWCRMPWWGVTWLLTTDLPRWGGKVLQNGDVIGGLVVLGLLVSLALQQLPARDGGHEQTDGAAHPADGR